MDRRKFIASSALAPAALRSGIVDQKEAGPDAAKRPLGMKLGCQAGPLTDERLEFLRRHSVEAVCGSPAAPRDGRMWDADELAQFRERVEKHGLTLDMVAPRFLESTHIDKTDRPAIMLGSSPERDRDGPHDSCCCRVGTRDLLDREFQRCCGQRNFASSTGCGADPFHATGLSCRPALTQGTQAAFGPGTLPVTVGLSKTKDLLKKERPGDSPGLSFRA